MKYFWVTEGLGNNTMVSDGFISAPKLTIDGKKLSFYDGMSIVNKGDIIFSFTNRHIISLGIAQSDAYSEIIPYYRIKIPTQLPRVGKFV